MSDAAGLSSVVYVRFKQSGASGVSKATMSIAEALTAAGKSAAEFELSLSKALQHPMAANSMTKGAEALTLSLKEQVKAFGLSGSAADRYARELGSIFTVTEAALTNIGMSSTAAQQAALTLTALTAATNRFRTRVGGAIPVINGMTLTFENLSAGANTSSTSLTGVSQSADIATGALERTGVAARTEAESEQQDAISTDGNVHSKKNLASVSELLSSSLYKVSAALTKLTGIANGVNTTFRRMYSTMRAVLFTFVIFFSIFKGWFDLASGFAETNHMLYTVSASLYRGAKNVKLLADGTIEFAEAMDVVDESTGRVTGKLDKLAGTEEDMKHLVKATDMFGNTLEDALYYDDEKVAQAFQSTIDYLDEIAYRMELDPTKLKQTYAQFLGMAQSSGMAAQQANALALGMTELTYDLASLWDVPFETAAQRMRSALAGITRAVQQFGLDVSKASMDAWLLSKGIDASYNSLSRADKMMAIYLKMMENTSAAQGDLARSALQPANMFRFLKEQAGLAARQLGAAIFPILTAVIPLFIHAAQAVQMFAASLSSFLGIKLGGWYSDAVADWNSYLSNLGSGMTNQTWMEELGEDLDDVSTGFDGAAQKAKDFKKQLLGFDEINNLTETEKGGGGGGGGGGGLGIDWSQFEMGDIWSRWDDDARTAIDGAAEDIKRALREAFDLKFGYGEFDKIVGWLQTIKNALFDVGDAGFEARTRMLVAFGVDVQAIPEHLRESWEHFKELIGMTNGTVSDFAMGFAEGILQTIGVFQKLIDKALEFGDWLKEIFNGNASQEGLGKFAGTIATAMPLFVGLLPVVKVLGGILSSLAPVFDTLGGLLQTIGIKGNAILLLVFETLKNSPLLRSSILPLLESIAQVIGSVIRVIDALFDILSPIFAIIGDIAGLLVYLIADLLGENGIVGFINWIADGLAWLGERAVALGEPIHEFFNGLIEWLAGIGDLGEKIKGFFDEFGHKISDFFSGFADWIYRIDSEVTAWFNKAWDDFWGFIDGILQSISNFFSNIWEKIKNFFSGSKETLRASMKDGNDQIVAFFSNIWNKIVTWFTELITSVPKKLGELWNSFNSILGGWPNKILDIGRNIVNGLWQGISNAWGWLKDNVSGLFGKLVSSIKKTLGIASPSKVFAEMGGWSMEGFGIGFDEESTQTLDRVLNTTDNIIQSVVQQVIGVPELTKDQLNSMTQMVGTAVTMHANAALQSQNNDMLAASQQELTLLREQNNLLTALLNKEIGVSLDGKQLAQSINYASRIQGRPLIAY